MLDRIADLTWRRPKLVLTLVGVLTLLAGGFAHDVEKHLKAAGFTDSASESERATEATTDALGYDANPALVLIVRDPDGAELDTASPALRREVARLSAEVAAVEHVGRVVDPLRDRRAAARSIARERDR